MSSHSAPMLGALSMGGTPLMDSYELQDYRDGYVNRSRHARKLKARSRRTARRNERNRWVIEAQESI